MKKTLFSFVTVTALISVILSGCTTPPNDCTPDENSSIGGYNGEHSILGGAYTFDDSLTFSNPVASDRKISIKSERLGTTLTGTYDASNCSKVLLDSIFITSQTIETVTLNNIRASGYGNINGNTVQTVINIKSGTATLGSLNIPLAGQSLTGTFLK
ncbi:MAG: hypothetical protein U0U67_09660 [Chitinophagales bacterium]